MGARRSRRGITTTTCCQRVPQGQRSLFSLRQRHPHEGHPDPHHRHEIRRRWNVSGRASIDTSWAQATGRLSGTSLTRFTIGGGPLRRGLRPARADGTRSGSTSEQRCRCWPLQEVGRAGQHPDHPVAPHGPQDSDTPAGRRLRRVALVLEWGQPADRAGKRDQRA